MKTKLLIALITLILLVNCRDSNQKLTNDFQSALAGQDLLKAKSIALQQLQVLRPVGTDEAPYIQMLYELARIYRQLGQTEMAKHFYLRTLKEASGSQKIFSEDKAALFREIINFPPISDSPELSNFVARSALHSLQQSARYPSPLFNPWLMILLPDYTAEKKSESMLFAAQNLILTGNEKERHTGLYYLTLAYYLRDQSEKFQRSAQTALESRGFPADYAVQIQILLAKAARAEKGILRSRRIYQKALENYQKYELANPAFLYDIYSGLAENFYLTRDFPKAKSNQQAAIGIARENNLSKLKLTRANSYLSFLNNEEKKYRK